MSVPNQFPDLKVPNQFPDLEPGDLRVAICGQSPGEDEVHQGQPFVGRAGRILDDALGKSGLVRRRCFVGNVCQERPEGNEFDRFEWDGAEVQSGIAALREDLEKFQPNIVLCLGNEALHLFKEGNRPPRKVWQQGRRVFDWPSKVGDWRGSLFTSDFLSGSNPASQGVYPCLPVAKPSSTALGLPLKCLSAYHPAYVARNWSEQAFYRCWPGVGDLERLRVEAASPALVLPQRSIFLLAP